MFGKRETAEKVVKKEKKYPKWIQWCMDYGYYYKGVLGVGVVIALLIVCMVIMFTYDGADMRLFFVTSDKTVTQEAYYDFIDKLSYYVSDADGDSNTSLRDNYYILAEDPQTDADKKVYATLDKIINDEETIAFVVDDFGYDYIKSKTELRDMAFYQVVTDDEYRFPLNDTKLFKDLTMGDGRNYYVVMRYFDAEQYTLDLYLSRRTDLWVGMMLNNDESEDNDVSISQK